MYYKKTLSNITVRYAAAWGACITRNTVDFGIEGVIFGI